jgi:hypothetical protein
MKLLMSALTIIAVAAFGFVAHAQDVTLPDGTPMKLRFVVYPLQEPVSAEELEGQAAVGATIPLWSATVKSLGRTYKYKMVGKNPQIKLSNPKTKVPFVIVPIKFIFANGDVFDPAAPDPTCSPAGRPLRLFLESPILKDRTYVTGDGAKVTTGQFPDLFQFANFFKFTGAPGGINPHFSFALEPRVLRAQPILVPADVGKVAPANCGNVGLINFSDWVKFVQTELFRELRSSLKPTTIPLFLFYNVFMCASGASGGCGIGGFHAAFLNRNYGKAFQTYAVSIYDTTELFPTVSADVSDASHEVDELQDDPDGRNPTPAWGHVGQDPNSCQNNLEVGDPLVGTLIGIPMSNGFTYHVQDLAFLSWFYRQSPSIGLGGVYSLFATFTTSAGPICHR